MPRQCGAGLRAQEVPLRSVVGTTAARVECHDARVADESDDSAAEREVLTNLPRTRPARRSARRASAASEPKPKRAPAKPAAAKRRATPKPKTAPAEAAAPPAPPPMPPAPVREHRSQLTDIAVTSIELTGELFHLGLSITRAILGATLGRIPRP